MRNRFPHPYAVSDAEAFLKTVAADASGAHVAIDVEGKAVGMIGIQRREDVHRLTAEIGYWLGEDFWGMGIATEALKGFTQHLFACTDLIRLDACVYAPNVASMRVLEKAGYQREGVLRSYVCKHEKILDAVIFAKLRETRSS